MRETPKNFARIIFFLFLMTEYSDWFFLRIWGKWKDEGFSIVCEEVLDGMEKSKLNYKPLQKIDAKKGQQDNEKTDIPFNLIPIFPSYLFPFPNQSLKPSPLII